MTFRKHILAGLVVALALPALALASSSGPTRYDIEQQPNLKNTPFAEPATNVKNTRNRTVDPKEVLADKAWSDRHEQEMRLQGADHLSASMAAGQR